MKRVSSLLSIFFEIQKNKKNIFTFVVVLITGLSSLSFAEKTGEVKGRLSINDKQTKTLALVLKAKANVKQGLDEEQQDWGKVVNEIEFGLKQALSRWKKKSMTSAATKVMKIQSRLYVASGLRKAISGLLGRERAMEHDRNLDKIRKMVHGISKEAQSESIIRSEIQALLKALKGDVTKIQ